MQESHPTGSHQHVAGFAETPGLSGPRTCIPTTVDRLDALAWAEEESGCLPGPVSGWNVMAPF